jgi:hypothetical protein
MQSIVFNTPFCCFTLLRTRLLKAYFNNCLLSYPFNASQPSRPSKCLSHPCPFNSCVPSCSFKGTVSRDNLYSIFFIGHILLVLLVVLYEDFKFRRISLCYTTKKETRRCRLHRGVWTLRCSLLIQPSRPANTHKGTIPEKSRL